MSSPQVSDENLTGVNPVATTRVVYDGGVFLAPIFGDMLVTANQHTQVRVTGPPKMQVLVPSTSQSLPVCSVDQF